MKIKLKREDSYVEFFSDPDEEHSELSNLKGYFGDAELTFNNQKYPLTFLYPVRVSQEIYTAFNINENSCLFKENVVIVEAISSKNLIRAVEGLVKSGEVEKLVPKEKK